MQILGIIIPANINVTAHIVEIVAKCLGTFHALHILRFHGLPSCALQKVARATLVARLHIRHTCIAKSDNAEWCRLERVLVRAKQAGYTYIRGHF